MRINFLESDPLPMALARAAIDSTWLDVFVVASVVGVVLAALYGIGSIRLSDAEKVDARAHARLSESRRALRESQTAWADLRATIRRANTVRSIRLSGTSWSLRLARFGDALPNDVWLTSFSDGDVGFDIRGGSNRFSDVAEVFDRAGFESAARSTVSATRGTDGLTFDIRPASDRR